MMFSKQTYGPKVLLFGACLVGMWLFAGCAVIGCAGPRQPVLEMTTSTEHATQSISIALTVKNLPSNHIKGQEMSATVRVLDSDGNEVASHTAPLDEFGFS